MSVMEPTRSFVSGADGFIGAHLVSALLDQGHAVRAMLRPGKLPRRLTPLLDDPNLELVAGDICTSTDLLDGHSFDFVFHLAGATLGARNAVFDRVNCGGTANLVRLTQQKAPSLRRFVFVSSLAAAGPAQDGTPLCEGAPEQPVSLYGASKLRAERELTSAGSPALPYTILRPGAVLGPGSGGLVRTAFDAARLGIRLEIGSGPQLISFVFVDDLVDAIVLSATSPAAVNKTYFISADNPLDLNAILERAVAAVHRQPRFTLRLGPRTQYAIAVLGELAGTISRTRPVFTRDKWREAQATNWLCSSALIKADLNWSPRVDVDKAVELLTPVTRIPAGAEYAG